MTQQITGNGSKSERAYEVRLLRPEDAQGVVNLFLAVYGEEYPVKLFYDAEALTRANENGDYYTVLARAPEGEVIGVQHAFRSAPYPSLYELGVGLVLKEWRGRGVAGTLGRYVVNDVIPRLNIEAAFGESVCYHLHMQHMSSQLEFTETALEVALMPAETYSLEEHAAGRVATLLQFRSYKPKMQTLFLPAVYDRELRFMYANLGDQREFARAGEDLPSGTPTRSDMKIFSFAQVARIAIHEAGSDLDSHLAALEEDAEKQGVVVLQACLVLTSSSVGAAVEVLRNRGYFLGGALPRWFDDDGLLMQKLLCPPDFEAIKLHNARAHEILRMVRDDWKRVQARAHG